MNNRERLFRRLLPIFGLIFAGMVLAGVAALAGTLEGERSDEPLLPDLKALLPEDFRIESDGEAGIKLLRFSSTVWNAGRGPLELRGESDPDTEETRVTQNLYYEKAGWRSVRSASSSTIPTTTTGTSRTSPSTSSSRSRPRASWDPW